MNKALPAAVMLAGTLVLTGCNGPEGVIIKSKYTHGDGKTIPAGYHLKVRTPDGQTYGRFVSKRHGKHCVVGAHFPECKN